MAGEEDDKLNTGAIDTAQADQDPGAGTEAAEDAEAAKLWKELAEQDADKTRTGLAPDLVEPAKVEAEEPAKVPPAAPADDKLWENATPEQRAALDAMRAKLSEAEHTARSNTGRVAGMQRRIDELIRETKTAKPAEKLALGDTLKQLKEDYPEVATPIEQALSPLIERINQQADEQTRRQQEAVREIETHTADQEKELENLSPSWFALLQKHGPAFQTFVDDQPRAVRDAFARNAGSIVDAQAASDVIEAFRKTLPPEEQMLPAKPSSPTPPLNDRRQRQLGANATPPNGARRPTVGGIPEEGDPQQIWDAFRQQEEARAARR